MKEYIFIFCAMLYSITLNAQTYDFKAAEDSLVQLRQTSFTSENDSLKLSWNKNFSELLLSTLSKNSSLNYPFDSLKSIAILSPQDKSFRIFNWEISLTDNSILYFGIVQYFNKKKKLMMVLVLEDKSASIKKPEQASLDPGNWYGAHYYKLIETQKKKKKYYTLLGANWSSPLLRKKIIEVISISPDGKLKFGEAIFQNNKITTKRVLFQYASEISMSLRYDENKKLILFDHLVPREANLKGQYEFYGPDMSIDGFDFVKGKWVYKEDVDARNQKNK